MEKKQAEDRSSEGLTAAPSAAADAGGGGRGLDPQQQALLMLRLRKRAGGRAEPSARPELKARGGSPTAALSFAQQRLLVIHQLNPDSPAYNMPGAVHIRGALDLAALERSLGEIIRRHQTLRTTFEMIGGKPAQVIAPALDPSLPVTDLTTLPDAEREAEVRRLRDEEALRPFDLARGPLLRVKLLKLGAEEFVLLSTMHHIVSDGWSMAIFIQEMATLYDAFSKGRPSPLPELPIQYADFAAWQREWLQGERLEEQLAYWRGQLAGAPPPPEFPTDRARPAVQSFRGARQTLPLDAELVGRLQELSGRENVTLFMTLLAGLNVLLYRYTGRHDISVGTPVANRTRAEVEQMIGFFINTLVLRTKLGADWSFRRLLAEVRQTALGAYAHQDLPFEKLVEEVQPAREGVYAPLFQVMFVLQNTPKSELKLGNLTLRPMGGDGGTAKFDQAWSITEEGRGLNVGLEYDADIFEAETIARILRHFRNVLEAAAADPEQSISDLQVFSPDERRRILSELNRTDADYSPAGPLHRLLLAQASRKPAATALLDGQAEVSYGRLNERAERLARHLRRLGVAPEARVGLLMTRTAETVVGLWAVLKAGGACVLLEPDAPAPRLAEMLQGAAVLLTERALAGLVPGVEVPLVEVDGRGEWEEGEAGETEGGADAQNLACVSYVSAPPGPMLGALNTYEALTNRVRWMQTAFPLSADDVVLLASPRGPDDSAWDCFWPLLCGARLVADAPAPRQTAADILRLVAERRVTVLQLTPSMLRALLSEPGAAASFQSLRLVLCGGGALPLELRQRFQDLASGAQLYSLYGTAETARAATFWGGGSTGSGQNAPLGRPVPNAQVYLLDPRLEPVPFGAVGELYVAGVGLARGYLDRPDLTAERFIPHPFSQEPGARLYKTGDVARYQNDGNVELLRPSERRGEVSRLDSGQEIEAALKEHLAVAEAVVVSREDGPGERRTVAYLVGTAGATPTPAQCRDFLRGRLAGEQMPAAFVRLESLPLRDDGTVELQALPAPAPEEFAAQEAHLIPRDIIELQLVQIWEQVLDVRPIDIKSNFFALRGTSLAALTLMIEVQEKFGQELPLDLLFSGATVESLAGLLREGQPRGPRSPLIPLEPGGSRPPFFCVHAVGGNVFPYLELARTLGSQQPFYALQARGLSGEQEPLGSVEEMARHYVEALAEVQPAGPYQLGGWSFGGVVAFEMARQLEAAGRQVSLLALLDSRPPASGAERPEPENNEAVLLANFLLDMGMMHGRSVRASYDEIGHLAPAEQVSHVWARARAADLIPPHLGREQLEHLLRVFKSNQQAFADYAPRPYGGRLVLFSAEGAEDARTQNDALAWGRLTTQGVEVRRVPGNHYTMLNRPHVQTLAEQLAAHLSGSAGEATTPAV